MRGKLLTIAACSMALVALALGGYRSLLLSIADGDSHEGDLRGIETAERLLPSSARYHFLRAQLVQQQDPTSREIDWELARAVALNPRFSDAMLSWSVDKEFSGDKTGARQLLLDARRVDRQLRPSWALANFYYRQGDLGRFWPEARECLRMIAVASFTDGRYDPVPIFQLCWSMQPDAESILSKVIPPDPQMEEIYLVYLLKYAKFDAQVGLVARMLPRATADDLWILIPHVNALILAGRGETAVREWNALIDGKLLPYKPLNPASGMSLTDGSFASGPSGGGFDWKTLNPEPVHFSFLEQEHTYRFEFDGTEPQQVNLLSEFVPLLPDRTYRFSSRYRAAFDAAAVGINWMINLDGHATPLRVVGVSGEGEKTLVLEFQTPDRVSQSSLLLSYTRNPGTTLIRGPFDLLQTSLSLQ